MAGSFSDVLDTFDLEFQHALAAKGAHRLTWGAGYRYAKDHLTTTGNTLAFLPARRQLSHGQAFVQDALRISPALEVTAGLKLETNPYTGTEFLPNLRFSYRIDERQLLWGELARALRAPSRIDRELYAPATAPHFQLNGGPNFESEVANVAELGYRAQPTPALSYSVTAFYQRYPNSRSLEPGPGGPQVENGVEAHTSGVEGWGSLRLSPNWRLNAGATVMRSERALRPGSMDAGGPARQGNDPRHTFQLRSAHKLGERLELDLALRRSGALPEPRVPAYTALDARLGWTVRPGLDLSLALLNLNDRRHPEWGNALTRAEVERRALVRLTWRP